jgi:hypothetical protein
MVWATVVLGIWFAIACYVARTYRRDYHSECQRHSDTQFKLAQMNVQAQGYLQTSDSWRTRYDALVEKIRLTASKPKDDSVIHARTSGDVRRAFERELASQEVEREKAMEN